MSTTTAEARTRLLAIGAFERDNFGDLLYPLLLQELLGELVTLDLGVPIEPAEAEPSLGAVRSYVDLLSEHDYSGIWVVGGEVGSALPEYAYLTRFGRPAHEQLVRAESDERRRRLRDAMGGHLLDPPYIPRLEEFAANAAAPLIVSSVGVSGIAVEPAWRRPLLEAALRSATRVSVREHRSGEVLDNAGIDHVCAPDLAHVVADVRPRAAAHDAILVHLSDQAHETYGTIDWARAIDEALDGHDGEIRLFLAGLAPGHDSLASAEALKTALLVLSPDRTVTISSARGVWDRVDEIAGARLWIGSSLHGRIVASSYGVPRISVKKPKVDAYAKDWDPGMPFGVSPEGLADAVSSAMGQATSDHSALADGARANLDAMLSALNEAAGYPELTLRKRLESMTRLTGELRDAARDATDAHRDALNALGRSDALLARNEERAVDLERRIRETSALLRAAEREAYTHARALAAVRSSRRWKLFETIDRLRARASRLLSRG